jgi:hypothetical protein
MKQLVGVGVRIGGASGSMDARRARRSSVPRETRRLRAELDEVREESHVRIERHEPGFAGRLDRRLQDRLADPDESPPRLDA